MLGWTNTIRFSNWWCRFCNFCGFLRKHELWPIPKLPMIPTQDKNRPKADLCSSWFINFCLLKILYTYHITEGVVNFPKTRKKCSKNLPNFFCRLAVLFLPTRKLFLVTSSTFFVPSKNSIRIWVFFFAFKHHIVGGQLPKKRCKIL